MKRGIRNRKYTFMTNVFKVRRSLVKTIYNMTGGGEPNITGVLQKYIVNATVIDLLKRISELTLKGYVLDSPIDFMCNDKCIVVLLWKKNCGRRILVWNGDFGLGLTSSLFETDCDYWLAGMF